MEAISRAGGNGYEGGPILPHVALPKHGGYVKIIFWINQIEVKAAVVWNDNIDERYQFKRRAR
jgi:hypothetical protein